MNGVSLKIHEWELLGQLGPDGAGKTTPIRMMCALVRPASGTALVAGRNITKGAAENPPQS